jgi:hypothetical protein
MIERPTAEWFRIQALQCIGRALRAKDPRIKRLYVLEAKRWLGLAQPEVDDPWDTAYRGVERRMTPRHQSPIVGLILLGRNVLVECPARDFSTAGVGLSLPKAIVLPAEFDLTLDQTTHHCVAVWRQSKRMGLKFKSIH